MSRITAKTLHAVVDAIDWLQDTGQVASLNRIAKRSDVPRGHVRRAIVALVEDGCLRAEGNGERCAIRYEITEVWDTYLDGLDRISQWRPRGHVRHPKHGAPTP